MSNSDNPFLALAAPGIARLTPYVPGKPVSELERELGISDSVKLASNENPLGPGSLARAAIAEELDALGRYPDGGGYALRRVLAEHHGVDADGIVLGNGSNDVLDLVARVFLQPGTESLFSEHAFAVYPIVTQAVGATARIAPAKAYGHDLDAMAGLVNDRTRVVWVANPNNPTGTWLPADALKSFIGELPHTCVVVVDEAYIEYVKEADYPDASDWVAEFPHLIVTRTFSKAHGLASLRVGYGICDSRIADLLNRVRQPFNLNSVAQAAAVAALRDRDHIDASVILNRGGMDQLIAGFKELGLAYIPSVGNFITVDLGRPAGPVNDALLRQGCIVRPVANYGLPSHLRVSIGTAEENDRLLAALKQVLAC